MFAFTATCAQAAPRPAAIAGSHLGSARPSDVATLRGARHSGASADQASATADGRITSAALLLLGAQSHAADAPAHTQPSTRRQLNEHTAEQAQKRVGRAQAARALGDNDCVHCSVRASSSTARGHRRIAPLALPDHQTLLRCRGRGKAALLPTRRAPPPTAESLQLRCCFSALRATPLMRLRTRSRQQGVK